MKRGNKMTYQNAMSEEVTEIELELEIRGRRLAKPRRLRQMRTSGNDLILQMARRRVRPTETERNRQLKVGYVCE